MVVLLGMAAAGSSTQAQLVRLQIKSVATSAGLKHPQRLSVNGDMAESAYNRTETVRITVANLQSVPADYWVEWQFLAKDLATKKNYVYDHGTSQVLLTGGSLTNFDVQSKPVAESEVQRFESDEDDNGNTIVYPAGNREKSGAKPVGYIFSVKAQGQVVAVEASDRDLKERYQQELNAHLRAPVP